MAKYLPYVNAYKSIEKVFQSIKKASVPSKFNQDFVSAKLGLKSSSYRAMIPFLKRLKFIDPGNVPTEAYKSFRDDSFSKIIMAERITEAYADLFEASEYAYTLDKKELTSKLKTLLGVSDSDRVLPSIVNTFMELCNLANFEIKEKPEKLKSSTEDKTEKHETLPQHANLTKLGISYTINLNLPPTTEIDVFNAIFKSLKEHILNDK